MDAPPPPPQLPLLLLLPLQAPYRRDLPWLFFGEEALQQQAMWCAGWDIYCPPSAIAFHLWSRQHRPTCQHGGSQAAAEQRQRSQRRAAAALAGQAGGAEGMPAAPTPRSLQQFWQHCGVDFAARTITERARNGGLPPGAFLTAADA